VARTFSYIQTWVAEGGQEFEVFSKNAVFLVSSGKKQISPRLAPLEKLLEKSTSSPPSLEKILPTPMHTST